MSKWIGVLEAAWLSALTSAPAPPAARDTLAAMRKGVGMVSFLIGSFALGRRDTEDIDITLVCPNWIQLPECPALLEKQLWGKGALCTYAAADARLPRLVLRVGDPRPGTGRAKAFDVTFVRVDNAHVLKFVRGVAGADTLSNTELAACLRVAVMRDDNGSSARASEGVLWTDRMAGATSPKVMAATMTALEALHLYLSARRARGNAYLQIRTFQLIQLLMAVPPDDSATVFDIFRAFVQRYARLTAAQWEQKLCGEVPAALATPLINALARAEAVLKPGRSNSSVWAALMRDPPKFPPPSDDGGQWSVLTVRVIRGNADADLAQWKAWKMVSGTFGGQLRRLVKEVQDRGGSVAVEGRNVPAQSATCLRVAVRGVDTNWLREDWTKQIETQLGQAIAKAKCAPADYVRVSQEDPAPPPPPDTDIEAWRRKELAVIEDGEVVSKGGPSAFFLQEMARVRAWLADNSADTFTLSASLSSGDRFCTHQFAKALKLSSKSAGSSNFRTVVISCPANTS